MLQFYAGKFFRIGEYLGRLQCIHGDILKTVKKAIESRDLAPPDKPFRGVLSSPDVKDKSDSNNVIGEFEKVLVRKTLEECEAINLRISCELLHRMEKGVYTHEEFAAKLAELQARIYDELETQVFIYLPIEHAFLFEDKAHFGEDVERKFPGAISDIREAAKCLAVGRCTASVFHLMRVMEFATQHLGKKLGITLVTEKRWANILDEVDKAIKNLPITPSKKKALRNRCAEASAHLRMVKDAWRNDVMHPKETYTEEEADRVFRNVKDFMVHLTTKL